MAKQLRDIPVVIGCSLMTLEEVIKTEYKEAVRRFAKARAEFAIPEGVEPLTALAIGYAAEADSLPDQLKERDTAPRQRKPLAAFVFGGKFGEASTLIK